MKINLKNKVALITGASQGMGFEIAKCLAMHGAKVFLVSRNKKNLIKAVARYPNIGNPSNFHARS